MKNFEIVEGRRVIFASPRTGGEAAFGPGQEALLRSYGFSDDDLTLALEQGTCRRAEPPATRAARALAREHALDLSDVEATGTGGRITKADVEAHLNDQPDAEQAEE